ADQAGFDDIPGHHQRVPVEVHAPILAMAERLMDSMDSLQYERTRMNNGMPPHVPTAVSLMHGIIDNPVSGHLSKRLQYQSGYYIPTFCVFEFLANTKGFMQKALADKRFAAALPADLVKKYKSKEYYDHYQKTYPNISYVKSHLGTLNENCRAMYDESKNVAMGTDMWALPGIGAHLELDYMVKSGVSPFGSLHCPTNV